MIESFAQLFKESLKKIKTLPGSIIRGTIISITKNIVLVDVGLKSESAIPIGQFYNAQGELEISVGDEIDVILDALEDGFGETLLSREKAKRHEAWLVLEEAYEKLTTVTGVISGKVKGGFTVELDGVRAFLPGSLVDIRPIRDSIPLEGKEFTFRVIKLDQKRNNVVVSRRAVIESENNIEKNQLLEKLQENIELTGIVKNLTDYGAFIDLGGIDGLLHITDMSWKRVKHPNEIVSIGDEIIVKVLKFDKERSRVSLGLKQLSEDPWVTITKRYQEGSRLIGKVTNLTDYGCFVEVEGGIEGLVHVSEMDWTNKNVHPAKIVSVDDLIDVVILDIDRERRRLSLGLKQCKDNPWQIFANTYKKGDKVSGKIKSITDFGIFIGLDGGIDGLVHISDVSWNPLNEEVIHRYKRGDEIIAVVLQVDSDRERISLGIKQLIEDPLNNYLSLNKKGSIVTGIVVDMNDIRGYSIKLGDGVLGCLSVSNIIQDNVSINTLKISIGDSLKMRITSVDRKNRVVNLSLDLDHTYRVSDKKCDLQQDHKNNQQQGVHFTNTMVEAFKAATKND